MTATLPPLAQLKPNPAWATLPLFDRTGWKRMAFGEFAESIGERAEPKDALAETASVALPDALACWLKTSSRVQSALAKLLQNN